MKAFVNDIYNCIGCYNCQISCKDEHCGNDWTPYAKPQPEMGHFWGKLEEKEYGRIPHVKVSFVFHLCQHCENAPCIEACPIGAISARADGLVVIDPVKCTGCQSCLNDDACPYGEIYYNKDLEIAQKCTGCTHLLDRGWPISEPRCVDICPTKALLFGEESELDLSGAETLHPEYGLNTSVYYKNLPKPFIAGSVYDPSSDEAVIGATCTLSGAGSETATTDNFGDFWLKGLKEGEYSLKIEKDGKSKTIEVSTVDGAKGLGDIALT
jgi:Fe-S-cluster-containing dehydrogenase component